MGVSYLYIPNNHPLHSLRDALRAKLHFEKTGKTLREISAAQLNLVPRISNLPKNPQAKAISQDKKFASSAAVQVREQSMEMTSGPLPHPEILGLYEKLSPGMAKTIVAAFESEYTHRRARYCHFTVKKQPELSLAQAGLHPSLPHISRGPTYRKNLLPILAILQTDPLHRISSA